MSQRLLRALMAGALLLPGSGPAMAAGLSVSVTGLRSGDGQVRVALYNAPKGFPAKAKRAVALRACTPADGGCSVNFADLAPGTYAVSAYHDEDNDGKMKTNFIGIPREGVGVSNNAKGRMGPPKFKDAAVQLPAEGLSLTISLTY